MIKHKWTKVTSNSLGFPPKGFKAWHCAGCKTDAICPTKPSTWNCGRIEHQTVVPEMRVSY